MNVKQAVPFFMVSSIEASVRWYVEGLGFAMTKRWIDGGKLRWCWLESPTDVPEDTTWSEYKGS
jgi:catechol 2,3-dioxygenase-like lactoylglutathione lyase family enzyme